MTNPDYTRSLESALALTLALDKNTRSEGERSVKPEDGLVKVIFSDEKMAGLQLTTDGYLMVDYHRAWPRYREEKGARVETTTGTHQLTPEMISWPGADIMILKADIPEDPRPIPYNVALSDVKFDPFFAFMNEITYIGVQNNHGIRTERIKGKIIGESQRSICYSRPDFDMSIYAFPTNIPNTGNVAGRDLIGGIFIDDTGYLQGIAVPTRPNYMLIPFQTMQDCARKAGITRAMTTFGIRWKVPA
ncbi:MAG: hypothetical protein ABIJ21_05985 [Nanoarchaeota archaeon]